MGSFASGGGGGIRDSCGGAGGFRWRPRGAGRGRLVAHPRIDARARGGVRRSLSRAGGRARRRERRASVRRRTCAARRTGARARGASLEAGLGGPPGRQTLASTKLLAQTASPSDESAEALAHAAGAKGPFGGCGSAVVRATRSAPRRAGVTSFSPRFSRRGPHGQGFQEAPELPCTICKVGDGHRRQRPLLAEDGCARQLPHPVRDARQLLLDP